MALELKKEDNWLWSYALLNDPGEYLVLIDRNGIITELTKAYADFLQIDRDQAIGCHVTDVIENTRMHVVLQTGSRKLARPRVSWDTG